MNNLISYRQTRKGDWVVCDVAQATYGTGIYKTGSPAPGYTTGHIHGRYQSETIAIAEANRIAAETGSTVVQWQHPTQNPQFVDLPRQYPERTDYPDFSDAEADGWIYISPSKTVGHYRGGVIFACDVTPGLAFGYDLALVVKLDGQTHPVQFARSQIIWGDERFSCRFRTGDVVDAIHAARQYIDRLVG